MRPDVQYMMISTCLSEQLPVLLQHLAESLPPDWTDDCQLQQSLLIGALLVGGKATVHSGAPHKLRNSF